jgi:protein O-mannosyl-transferase
VTAAPAPSARAWGLDTRTAAWIVAVLAALAFVPAVHGGFVYDDHRFLAENPHLDAPSILWRAFTDPSSQTSDGTHAGLWRPLRTLSFALDRALFGAGAAGPHAVNVALHAAGAALVTLLLGRWRVPAAAALLGGALYALHPVQVEALAWISSRGDLLAAAAVWGALLADVRGRPVLAALLGAAALLSKEQAIVWPALAVLSRVAADGRWREALRAARVPAALTVVYLVGRHVLLTDPLQQGGLGARADGPTVVAMTAHQLWTTVVPGAAAFDWQMPVLGGAPWPALLVVLGAMGAAVWVRAARVPLLWFCAALVPTLFLQVAVPLNIRVADRFLLFALPALGLLAGRGLARAPSAWPAVALAAAALAVQTETRIPPWRSDEALWASIARAHPGHWRAESWLGVAALREKRFDEAEAHLVRAAEALPTDGPTRFYLAAAQEVGGARTGDAPRLTAALRNYQAAIVALKSSRAEGAAWLLPEARWAEAELLLMLGHRQEAGARIEELLAEPPGDEVRNPALRRRAAQLAERTRLHLDQELGRRIRERFAGASTGP